MWRFLATSDLNNGSFSPLPHFPPRSRMVRMRTDTREVNPASTYYGSSGGFCAFRKCHPHSSDKKITIKVRQFHVAWRMWYNESPRLSHIVRGLYLYAYLFLRDCDTTLLKVPFPCIWFTLLDLFYVFLPARWAHSIQDICRSNTFPFTTESSLLFFTFSLYYITRT